MECEICGRQTSSAKMVVVDGSTLIACRECSSFGKETENASSRETASKSARQGPVKRVFLEPKPEMFDLGLEIVPDFGKRVMQARQKAGLTAKELALKIFEKESLLHRVENQAIKPSDALIGKLEKELGIKLREKKASGD